MIDEDITQSIYLNISIQKTVSGVEETEGSKCEWVGRYLGEC